MLSEHEEWQHFREFGGNWGMWYYLKARGEHVLMSVPKIGQHFFWERSRVNA